MKTSVLTATLLFGIVSNVIAQDGPGYSHTGPTMIKGVRIIDGLGGEPKENQDIVLIDGKIESIGPTDENEAPENALVIDGNGMTAMPGLIDMHVHLQGGWAVQNHVTPAVKYGEHATTVHLIRFNLQRVGSCTIQFEFRSCFDLSR